MRALIPIWSSWRDKHRYTLHTSDDSLCVHVTSQGNGPLAEIEFWRERNATLSALHEQTKLPIVRRVLDVIKESDSMLAANLQPVLTELFKLHMEASDNVRFLSTVERHFKVRRGPGALESRGRKLDLTRIEFPFLIQHLNHCGSTHMTLSVLTACKRVAQWQ